MDKEYLVFRLSHYRTVCISIEKPSNKSTYSWPCYFIKNFLIQLVYVLATHLPNIAVVFY
jgi:hypothetical protein